MVDFTGSTCEVYGNCNAPRAVTLSALIYCLRCMVGHDVPLNQVSNTKQKIDKNRENSLSQVCCSLDF